MSSPEVRRLFPTPVYVESWAESSACNELLRNALLDERSAAAGGVSKSNFLGWQSQIDMLRWGGPAAKQLREHAVRLCEPLTFDAMAPRPLHWHVEMWGNISGRGASNQTHSHPGAFWSVVYYVDDGYAGSDDRALGGELTFVDPRFPIVRMRSPSLRACFGDADRDHHEVWVRPRTGMIVIFPSWLQHAVRPYNGTGERMSIAINVTIYADPTGSPE
jgi:uncharacterized protein (TIGR02466 family)